MSHKDDIKRLIAKRNRYLLKLKEQQASLGLHTPPHILTEIEDVETGIKNLELELEQLAAPFFGPLNGELKHDPPGIVWYKAGVSLSNFIAEATFYNPYSAINNPWMDVVFFRNGFRVWVKSNKEWGYGYFNPTWKRVGSGKVPQSLALNEGQSNRLKVAAYNASGCLHVNDNFIAELDLSGLIQPGDIAIGTSEHEFQVTGAVTIFGDFKIYIANELECPK